MSLYSYKKKPVGATKKVLSFFSYTTMTVGAIFLFWSFYPVIASALYNRIFIQNDVLAPIPNNQMITSLDKAESVKGTSKKYSTNLVDYTKASAWFIDNQENDINKYNSDITEYSISIPKLDIYNAKVIVGGDDLFSGLIQYLPENPPGIDGTVNIFGHSTTPALTKKNDYKSIFTYLPTLVVGDSFYVTVDGVKYTYEIFDRLIIQPDQISALNPKYDGSYINLFTCVPLGTYKNRLQVKAKLIQRPLL